MHTKRPVIRGSLRSQRPSFSASFVMRRYFATADDYVGVDALAGQTPRDR